MDAVQADLSKQIRTVVPATVVSYSPTGPYGQTATVQPAPKERDEAGEYESQAQIQNAPVLFPQGGGWSISWALLPGDPVLLFVPDRSTELWRVTGDTYEPQNALRHALTYGFVWPGAGQCPDPVTGLSATDFHIRGPAGLAITITPAGQIVIGTNQAAAYAARVADPVAISAALTTWMTNVGTALSGLGVPVAALVGSTIGNIASGSTTVRVN